MKYEKTNISYFIFKKVDEIEDIKQCNKSFLKRRNIVKILNWSG